jgi:eukaryotic-like serine/threonine-protein kinase
MDLENGTIINQYKILSSIGKGGMGEVFLALDTKLDRKVALKILPSEFAEDADRMNRFVREAKSASALNHPNIITIYEIGESGGTHYIATEFIEGGTLRKHLKGENFSLKTVLDIAIQIASALQTAHSAGIVHRDIKPDNVMIRSDGLAKILDFGIAKLSEPPMIAGGLSVGEEDATAIKPQSTSPGLVVGTANYMSPEQAKGKEIDARSDIFSFGIVFYEMLTGKRAFEGETALESISSILKDEPRPISQILPDVPSEIERIVNKTLRKDRDERYQTAKDLLIDLKDAKQSLELQNLLERTAAPEKEEPKTQILPATTAVEVNQTTTNQTVQRNPARKYLAVGLMILLLSAISFFAYRYFTQTKQIESIAVMPFINESGNADVEYLSDGMTETLIKSLSNLPNLNVKPRSSVFRYKGKETDLQTIARELNVQAILNGRVVQRGDQLTLSLELVDVSKDKVIWTESYNRKQSDLVTLQSEIARDVSTNLKAKLSGADEQKVTKSSTSEPEAYQAYLKGRYYWNRRTTENLKKAIEQFKIATDRDPNYALAYAGLADCYILLNQYAGTPLSETIPQAKLYAERAIAIDDQLAEPHSSLGSVYEMSWQWTEAEREYKRAIELNPNYATAYHWYSNFLKNLDRYDEAALMIQRAHDIDPLSSAISVNLSRMYQFQNDHNASIENSLKIIELDPKFPGAYQSLGLSYLKQGRNAEAIASFEKAVELSNRAGETLMYLGYGYGVTGKRTEAIAILKESEEKYSRKETNARYVAGVYAGLGEKDKAFEWLEKDFQSKGEVSNIRWAIPFESLRDDPRYKDLLKRMNLPE